MGKWQRIDAEEYRPLRPRPLTRRRRLWLWLTRPYRMWQYRRMFERAIIIVRGDQ